ncbi:MAG: DegT/DnrJ/EryC1/StrS aminotransferase family protein [Myxococcales bacterium]|nr:DegT/DnrJ/EryC1/StrS aminotransferase family protein [Myxococcales bacterium]MCB9715619.1 DegT/DnrJ/EryC1/StrS aminotransferase family protein [Myxococcales bacterium]
MSNDFIVFGSPVIGPEEIEAVTEVLRSCWLGTGPRTKEFEKAIAEYTGAEHAIAVSSCTAALHLSLLALGIGPGDEVITTPMTFAATANSIVHTGATPVFVDCDRSSLNLDPAGIEAAITERTKAILPVHFAGRAIAVDEILAVARKHDLLVIEDAAHALETRYKGRPVGRMGGTTSCLSFYVTKNITTAEGGMLLTNDEETARKARVLSLHGLSADAWSRYSDAAPKHYEVVVPGYKYNLTDIASSIGLVQLRHVEEWLPRRDEIWARYDEGFADLPVTTPAPVEPETRHARHLYTLLVDDEAPVDRDGFRDGLHREGVGTGIHYAPLHRHPYYRERFGLADEHFPNASHIGSRTVSLPLSPKVTDAEVDRIIAAVRKVTGGK